MALTSSPKSAGGASTATSLLTDVLDGIKFKGGIPFDSRYSRSI
jgi:hypothetical protein